MEKKKIFRDSLGFKIYNLWKYDVLCLLGGVGVIKEKLAAVSEEDIENSCHYRKRIIINLVLLPFWVLFNLVFVVAVVVFGGFLISSILLGFWPIFNSDKAEKVAKSYPSNVFNPFYPYKYCPWTNSYWKVAPWQILVPLALLYFGFFFKGEVLSFAMFSLNVFWSNIFLGLFIGVALAYLIFRALKSQPVQDLWGELKEKYCAPVELVEGKKRK